MATHPIETLLLKHENEQLTLEQTVGHSLQHIQQLQQAQNWANQRRAELNEQVQKQAAQLKEQSLEINRLRTQLNQLLQRQQIPLKPVKQKVG